VVPPPAAGDRRRRGANGNANPAQRLLDVHATKARPAENLKIYAFAASLGGPAS
jgi:hypothetical protein